MTDWMARDPAAWGRGGRHRRQQPATHPGLRLLADCRPRPRQLLKLAFWTVIEAAPTIMSGLAVAHAVDGFRTDRAGTAIIWLAALALAICCGGLATRGLYATLAPAVEETRDHLMGALVRGSVATLAATGRAGSAPLTQLVDQVDQVRNLLSAIARNVRTTVAPMLAAMVGLFALSPLLGMVVAVPLLAAGLLYAVLLRPMFSAERAAAVADEDLGASATAVLDSRAAVGGLGAQLWAVDQVSSAANVTGRADLRVARLHAWRHAVIALGGYAPLIVVLLVAGPGLDSGKVSLGDVTGAMTYILTALLPALSASITGAGGWFIQLLVLLDRLATIAQVRDVQQVVVPTGPDQSSVISARGASFTYRGGARGVLDNLHLSVGPGELVALVGPSGAGKTTLAHLIAGLLTPTQGAIGVGRRLRPVLLPQSPYVFCGSVRDNLTYLSPGDDAAGSFGSDMDDELWRAIDAVGLRAAAERWGGLDGTVADSEANRPTPSQAQRLVLARGWLSGAPVVVLDEAWSLLDAADRRGIEAWLRDDGRTLVVISHHLDVPERADLVVYFDGRSVHSGTHLELSTSCGSYAELFSFAGVGV